MSEDLFGCSTKERWSDYPWIFRPNVLKLLFVVVVMICLTEILISFIGIPKDAQVTAPGFEKLSVPVAVSVIILFVLPLPCIVVGRLLAFFPINSVPYNVRFTAFSLLALLLLQAYGLKELIAASMHG